MGPQAGDPQGREVQPNFSFCWGRFSSFLVLPTFQSPFFFIPVKVQSSAWHICAYQLLFSVPFSISPPSAPPMPRPQTENGEAPGAALPAPSVATGAASNPEIWTLRPGATRKNEGEFAAVWSILQE